jgi:hypothetical protein
MKLFKKISEGENFNVAVFGYKKIETHKGNYFILSFTVIRYILLYEISPNEPAKFRILDLKKEAKEYESMKQRRIKHRRKFLPYRTKLSDQEVLEMSEKTFSEHQNFFDLNKAQRMIQLHKQLPV